MKNKNKGFSLIEVAIAVLVVSLIATFSLKGKELIRTAQLRATIEQIETFQVAINTFIDRYNALPGDLTNAKDLIDSSLDNGSGSGNIISVNDAKRFWSHLTKAGLITVEMQNGFPIAKVGGFFSVSSNINGKPGNWLILSKGTNDNIQFQGVLTPSDAYYIDKNIDTGLPNEGDVQVMQASNVQSSCILSSNYNFKDKSESCVLLFKF